MNTLKFGSFPPRANHIDEAGPSKTMELSFGRFKHASMVPLLPQKLCFKGRSFDRDFWGHIPNFMLRHILDQRKFGYTDDHMSSIWNLSSILQSKEIYRRLILCSLCDQSGHLAIDYQVSSDSDHDSAGSELWSDSPSPLASMLMGPKAQEDISPPYFTICASTRLKCSYCSLLGHSYSQCLDEDVLRMLWKPKGQSDFMHAFCDNSDPMKSKQIYCNQKLDDMQHFPNNIRTAQRKSVKYDAHRPRPLISGNSQAHLIWIPKGSKQSSLDGQVPTTHGKKTLAITNPPNRKIWRIKSLQRQLILGSNMSQFSFVRGDTEEMNIRVIPFRKLLAFFIAFIYKAMPPMLMSGVGQMNTLTDPTLLFGMKLQFLFVASVLKQSLSLIASNAYPLNVRVDKRNWENAFIPIMIPEVASLKNDDNSDLLNDQMGNSFSSQLVDNGDQPNFEDLNLGRQEKKKKMQTLIDPIGLRRSTRDTKYDGFKAPSMAEGIAHKSKVKPRQVPPTPAQSNTTSAGIVKVPPPTAITTLQQIGTVKCSIPTDDLAPSKLLAKKGATAPSSSTRPSNSGSACLEH